MQSGKQFWFRIERAEQMDGQFDLGRLVGNTDKRRHAKMAQAMHLFVGHTALPDSKRGARILIRMRQAMYSGVKTANANRHRRIGVAFEMFQQMKERIDEETVTYLWRLRPVITEEAAPQAPVRQAP